MSKPTWVLLLCEDNLTSVLLRSYLRRCGIDQRIRVSVSPSGRGAAENWVIRQYPEQVNAYVKQNARTETWLIVAVDADGGTVAGHIGQLDAGLRRSENLRLRRIDMENEKIARLVPRRNIETWILALCGTVVDEIENYKKTKHSEDWDERIPDASRSLYAWTRANANLPADLIDSLRHGIRELGHLAGAAS